VRLGCVSNAGPTLLERLRACANQVALGGMRTCRFDAGPAAGL